MTEVFKGIMSPYGFMVPLSLPPPAPSPVQKTLCQTLPNCSFDQYDTHGERRITSILGVLLYSEFRERSTMVFFLSSILNHVNVRVVEIDYRTLCLG